MLRARRRIGWRGFILVLQCLFTSSSVFANQAEDNDNSAIILGKTTRPILIEADPPVYPRLALQRGIEGWVVISLAVMTDGTTDDIRVVASSIEDYFDDAAVASARTRIYRPATSQGEPVVHRNLKVRSTFQFKDSEGGVSRIFLRTYNEAKASIEAGDLDLAESLIAQLDEQESRLLAEVCYLDMIKSIYHSKKGNDKAALRHLEHALVIADDVALPGIYIGLLRRSVVLNAKANNFQTSLKRYQTLLDTDEDLAPDDPIHKYVKRIRETLDGEEVLQFTGKISINCKTCEPPAWYWRHVLNRNRFLIDQVVGQVSEVRIICQNSSISVAHNPETVWSVDRGDGECVIRVIGEEKTTFRLLELANENQE